MKNWLSIVEEGVVNPKKEEMESIQQRAAADGVEFFSEYAEPSASSEVKLEVEKFVEIEKYILNRTVRDVVQVDIVANADPEQGVEKN